jgi:hypothetical protein
MVGVPETEASQSQMIKLEIANNGWTVDKSLKLRLPKKLPVPQLKERLLLENLILPGVDYRVSETWSSKLYKIYSDTDMVQYALAPLRIDGISDECSRLDIEAGDHLVPACRVYSTEFHSFNAFDVPFYVPVFRGETVGQVKGKIKQNLEMSDELFATIIFALSDQVSLKRELMKPLSDEGEFIPRMETDGPHLYLVYSKLAKTERPGALLREVPVTIKN